MSLWDIIPTSDYAMSPYTLVTFVILVSVLTLAARAGMRRLDDHEEDIKHTDKAINEMQINVAVMAESLKNIESDGTETRTAIAEINRTLIAKL